MSEETTEEFPESGKSETDLSSRNVQDEQSNGSVTSEDNSESANSDEIGESSNRGESSTNPDDEPETFPRDYVEKLRDENAKYRQRAQRSDELAHRLHRALVAADGRLADPTDLEFDDEHLEDADTLSEAIDGLLETKPHLAARKPVGDIGQGAAGPNAGTVDLAGLLRAGAN